MRIAGFSFLICLCGVVCDVRYVIPSYPLFHHVWSVGSLDPHHHCQSDQLWTHSVCLPVTYATHEDTVSCPIDGGYYWILYTDKVTFCQPARPEGFGYQHPDQDKRMITSSSTRTSSTETSIQTTTRPVLQEKKPLTKEQRSTQTSQRSTTTDKISKTTHPRDWVPDYEDEDIDWGDILDNAKAPIIESTTSAMPSTQTQPATHGHEYTEKDGSIKQTRKCPRNTAWVTNRCVSVVRLKGHKGDEQCPDNQHYYEGRCRPYIKARLLRPPKNIDNAYWSVLTARPEPNYYWGADYSKP